ncbi:MAG: hypothetical protein ACYTX0_58480, partial [Nostoc sp.]
ITLNSLLRRIAFAVKTLYPAMTQALQETGNAQTRTKQHQLPADLEPRENPNYPRTDRTCRTSFGLR